MRSTSSLTQDSDLIVVERLRRYATTFKVQPHEPTRCVLLCEHTVEADLGFEVDVRLTELSPSEARTLAAALTVAADRVDAMQALEGDAA